MISESSPPPYFCPPPDTWVLSSQHKKLDRRWE